MPHGTTIRQAVDRLATTSPKVLAVALRALADVLQKRAMQAEDPDAYGGLHGAGSALRTAARCLEDGC
jgi:hypothetical protein